MSRHEPSWALARQSPLGQPPGERRIAAKASSPLSQSELPGGNRSLPDEEPDETWDDDDPDDPDDPLDPFDDSDLEIDEEPEPDEGDFWIDPDESEDPWN